MMLGTTNIKFIRHSVFILLVIPCHCPETSDTLYSYCWWYCATVLKQMAHKIQNNFNSVKNLLKEHITQNFTPMRCKELLAEKCTEAILFHKIVTTYTSSLLTSFFADMPSFSWPIHGKYSILWWWLSGNTITHTLLLTVNDQRRKWWYGECIIACLLLELVTEKAEDQNGVLRH